MLSAIALARETDAPLLGCLLGLTGAAPPEDPGRTVAISPEVRGPTGPAELGVLADLALGSSLRAEIGRDHRLATVSLTLELTGSLPLAAWLSMHTRYVSASGRSVLGTGVLRSGRTAIGAGLATFSARERGAALLPWEPSPATPSSPTGGPPSAASGGPPSNELQTVDLDADEAAVLSTVTASDLAPATALLQAGVVESEDGRTVLRPRPVLANRAGAVQGGVLIGVAATTAAPDEPADLHALHIDYVAPAMIDDDVLVEATVLRGGARTRSVRVDLSQNGSLVAAATVRHRLR